MYTVSLWYFAGLLLSVVIWNRLSTSDCRLCKTLCVVDIFRSSVVGIFYFYNFL